MDYVWWSLRWVLFIGLHESETSQYEKLYYLVLKFLIILELQRCGIKSESIVLKIRGLRRRGR